jgi:hypothetical protein
VKSRDNEAVARGVLWLLPGLVAVTLALVSLFLGAVLGRYVKDQPEPDKIYGG